MYGYPGQHGQHGQHGQYGQQGGYQQHPQYQQQQYPQQQYPQQYQQPPQQYHQPQQYQQHQQHQQQYAPPHGAPPQQYAPPSGPPSGPSPGQWRAPQNAPPAGLDPWGFPASTDQSHPRGHAPPPPDGAQQFGHGAPEGYTFKYSHCTGKRKALIIGINYFGQEGELKGCVNDTKNISGFLIERYGYKREDMVILTDDQTQPPMIPTKENILRAMQWLVRDAKPDDSLFFHYSGHGGRVEDLDGDEDDGYDECIYPVDFRTNGEIIDDLIHEIMVRTLPEGTRLTAIFDSCHSGSALDLPYIYSTKGVLKEPNLAAEAGKGLLDAAMLYMSGKPADAITGILGVAKGAFMGGKAREKTVKTRTSSADVVMWSGCKDVQTSADATIASQATGAMSWAFITALKAQPEQSYVELLNNVRDLLEKNYSQKPQLSCSHPLDTNLRFVM